MVAVPSHRFARNGEKILAALKKKGGSVTGKSRSDICRKLGLARSMTGTDFPTGLTYLQSSRRAIWSSSQVPEGQGDNGPGRYHTVFTLSLPGQEAMATTSEEAKSADANSAPRRVKKRKTRRTALRRS